MVNYESRTDLSNLVSFTAYISIQFSFKRTSISSLCFNKDGALSEQISNPLFLPIALAEDLSASGLILVIGCPNYLCLKRLHALLEIHTGSFQYGLGVIPLSAVLPPLY